MEITEIYLKNIEDKIPSLLIKKLHSLKIKKLSEVQNIDNEDFSKIKGIGKSVVEKLIEFKKFSIENLYDLENLQLKNTQIYNLPINNSFVNDSNILEQLNDVITDYLNLLEKDIPKKIINHIYGLNNSDQFTLDDLSNYYPITRERIRQIKHSTLQDIRNLLNGDFIPKQRCMCHPIISDKLKQIRNELINKNTFTKSELFAYFKDEYNCENPIELKSVISLLIDLFNFTECGIVETAFTRAQLIIVNDSEKSNFLKASERVLKLLVKKIIPLNKMQVVIEIKRSNKSLFNTHIIDALNILPEIEILEGNDQVLYQAKFEYLSRASDRAYRVLIENGTSMYIDDISSEINSRLAHTATTKIYDRHSLALASDKRFSPEAKTGYWNLKEWKKNGEKIEILIKNALYKINEPSTYKEIYDVIIKERSNIKENSVRSIIGRDCYKVEGNKWILPEWKQKYSDLAYIKRKKRIKTTEPEYKTEQRALIIRYLQKKERNEDPASSIIKEISPFDKKFTKVSFYKVFEQEEYFSKTLVNRRLIIKLKEQESNTKIAIDLYNWKNVKFKLERDLKGAFEDNTSPNYNYSLSEIIELFNEVIMLKTQQEEFDGLPDRILGNLNKYYHNSTDRTDSLNFLKQFLTCLDPLLKKVLCMTNEQVYLELKRQRKGLGEIFRKLDKLDPTEERFKSSRNARSYRFGKQIQSTYNYRNSDTHDANDWTSAELTTAITNCFTVYLFTCAEYFDELSINITQHNNAYKK